MMIIDFFHEIRNLIVEDLNDDANFEEGFYYPLLEMKTAGRLKSGYSKLRSSLFEDCRRGVTPQYAKLIKKHYDYFQKWIEDNIKELYYWEEECSLGGRQGVAHCLKCMSFETRDAEEEFMKQHDAMIFVCYERDSGKKVVCEYMLLAVETIKEDVRDITGVIFDTDNKETTDEPNIPQKLDTPKGIDVLKRGVGAGFLNESFMPIKGKMTRAQQKMFALYAGTELGIDCIWKTFQDLWNCKNLAQVREVDAKAESLDAIKVLFPREVVGKTKYR